LEEFTTGCNSAAQLDSVPAEGGPMETMQRTHAGEAHAPLSPKEQEVGLQLQATLVELVDLALLGKQFHWSVVGAAFRPLHLQLDELVGVWHALGDTVAERAVALGCWPDGQAGTIAAANELEPISPGALADQEVVRLLTERLSAVVGGVRVRMDQLGSLDLASQDVLIEVVRALEEQLWMIRAQRVDRRQIGNVYLGA
jgi:starvation-inducible DNA-binding protein